MFTNDYIMRQIEMLVRGIAVIMKLKQENKTEECAQALTDTLRRFYGLGDDAVETLPWRSLMNVASFGPVPDAERCALLAQLIREKADLYRMSGDAEHAGKLACKALCVYLSAWLQDESLRTPEHEGNIAGLAAASGFDLPEDAARLLGEYRELGGALNDRAE